MNTLIGFILGLCIGSAFGLFFGAVFTTEKRNSIINNNFDNKERRQ